MGKLKTAETENIPGVRGPGAIGVDYKGSNRTLASTVVVVYSYGLI